jgi:anti-sigma factor RsiW
MNCPDVQLLLHPYADGELDVVRHVEVESHLTGCTACAEQEKRLRSLRSAVSSPPLYYRAPAGLRARLQTTAPSQPASPRRRAASQLATIAAAILLLLGTSAMIGTLVLRAGPSADEQLAERVVESHVRSLQVTHLTDVPSSDRHTVKPWFRDKLDFSPHVPDLAGEGYALAGGRLDYLAGRPVAALIYHRRLHIINLFTWPTGNDEAKTVRQLSRQGFHIRCWQASGMTYWAISDLNDPEMDEFVRLVR